MKAHEKILYHGYDGDGGGDGGCGDGGADVQNGGRGIRFFIFLGHDQGRIQGRRKEKGGERRGRGG